MIQKVAIGFLDRPLNHTREVAAFREAINQSGAPPPLQSRWAQPERTPADTRAVANGALPDPPVHNPRVPQVKQVSFAVELPIGHPASRAQFFGSTFHTFNCPSFEFDSRLMPSLANATDSTLCLWAWIGGPIRCHERVSNS